MSLSSFVATMEVRDKIKPLRPKLPRKIDAPLKVEPRTKHYSWVGTAFDYLLRFELQRQAPHAVARQWVAEAALDRIWGERDGIGWYMDPRRSSQNDDEASVGPDEKVVWELAQRVRTVIQEAKEAVAIYTKSRKTTKANREELASHALRLAQLDRVIREWDLDPQFEAVDSADVGDLLALLAIVPPEVLVNQQTMLLNPTFEESSMLVGGADADLITGDMLVDFKVTKKTSMKGDDLDQLLGYFLLARNQHRIDPRFPEIKKLGLYFCRHGHLWSIGSANWTDHPNFSEVEKWFLKRAEEVFPPSQKL